MTALEWIATGTGLVLLVSVLIDTFLTILHLDREGPIARRLFRLVWKTSVRVGRVAPRLRRSAASFAGPLMLVAIFGAWTSMFSLGFALVYWPHLDHFALDREPWPLTFVDALYYSGGTTTILGFGDITPAHPALKLLSVVHAALGFALFTSIFAYLINLVFGAVERNSLALRVWIEAGRDPRGEELVARSLLSESASETRARLQSLTRDVHRVAERLYQFPVLDLFYRSRDPMYAPEALIDRLTRAAIGAELAATRSSHRALGPVAWEVGEAVTEIMKAIATEHLAPALAEELHAPPVTPADEELVRAIDERLEGVIGPASASPHRHDHENARTLAARGRVFLEQLDRLTNYRADQPEPAAMRARGPSPDR